jgi:hypothetical protein
MTGIQQLARHGQPHLPDAQEPRFHPALLLLAVDAPALAAQCRCPRGGGKSPPDRASQARDLPARHRKKRHVSQKPGTLPQPRRKP